MVAEPTPSSSPIRDQLAELHREYAQIHEGEVAIIDRALRSATIVADTPVSCDLLSLSRLTALGVTHPKIKIRLLENLSLDFCRKLRKANCEIALLV